MKKVLVLVLALVMVMSMGTMAFANTQTRTTVLSADKTEIEVGESVAFTATTLKHGSNYANPSWYLVDEEGQRSVISSVGDEDVTNTVFADDYYTSTRSIKFNEAGTYVVEFEIVMAAGKGKSNVQFVATDRVTVVVNEPATAVYENVGISIGEFTKIVVKFHPKNVDVINNVTVTFDVYFVLSNGTEVLANTNVELEFDKDDLEAKEKTYSYEGFSTIVYYPVN